MKKTRVSVSCVICNNEFEIRPCEVKAIKTCSKECSIKYRSIISKGRPCTWSEKIQVSRRINNKEVDRSYITEEYKQDCKDRAIKNNLGKSNAGITLSSEHKKKISAAHIGHSRGGWLMNSDICKKRQDRAKKGADCNFWKGGVTTSNAAIRSSHEYKQWRKNVFERDGYTCQICGINGSGVVLNADHIKPFAYFVADRFDIENGRTLCVECHKKTPTYMGRCIKYMKEVHGT